MGPPKHANYLFSLNVDSESFQYLIDGIEHGTHDRRGGEISSPHPTPSVVSLSPSSIAPSFNDSFREIFVFGKLDL